MDLKPNKTAVLLLSSGLDSAANLALASEHGFEVKLCLTVDYGQRSARQEIQKSKALAKAFGVEHVVLAFNAFSDLVSAQSSLFSQQAELPSPEKLDDFAQTTKSAKAVWVPNRNGVLLSLAAALAESRGLDAVAVGFNAEEAVTFPDNTADFMQALTRALWFSTANHVEVVSATVIHRKTQIVDNLVDKNFPFELLWSCYRDQDRHCGQCESCRRLHRAVTDGVKNQQSREGILTSLFGKEPGNAS